jgi:Na+-translocating ferredoxin:NAD+ oxidoreductase RnfD subunit
MGSAGGISVVEWSAVGASAVVGAVVVYVRRDRVYAIASSLLGSAGICVVLSILAGGVPLWSVLLIFTCVTLGGVGCQHLVKNRQRLLHRPAPAVQAARVGV